MGFFSPPKGYAPADSMTVSLATAAGVLVIYGSKVGPVADVHTTATGDININASIKKAGWEALALVAGMTLLSRDLNVAILGGAAIVLEHTMYLHAEMANPANGQITANPAAYAAAGTTGAVLASVG